MIASHYALKDILEDANDPEKFKSEFKKIAQRYSEDTELQLIFNEFSKSKGDVKNAVKKLTELYHLRRMESTEGGEALPYRDRRHLD